MTLDLNALNRDVKDARKLVHDLITDLGGNLDADTRARLEGLEAALAARVHAHYAPLVAAAKKLTEAARRCASYAEGVSPDRVSAECDCPVCDLVTVTIKAESALAAVEVPRG